MNTNIYVDNLAAGTTETALTDLFSTYGNVVGVKIVVDRTRPEPSAFGFVTMVTPEGARAAVQALNGMAIGAHALAASEAWPAEVRSSSGKGRRDPHRRTSKLF
jgi:RNA recognition motif-containing protein